MVNFGNAEERQKVISILQSRLPAVSDELLRDKFHPDLRRLHRFTMDDGRTRFSNYINAKLYRKLVNHGWRYTGCEGYVIVPDDVTDDPPAGCVPVYQRCGGDGSAVLSTGEEVPPSTATAAGSAAPVAPPAERVKVGIDEKRTKGNGGGGGRVPKTEVKTESSAAAAASASASTAAAKKRDTATPTAPPKFAKRLADGSRLLGFIPTTRHPDNAESYSELREYRHLATGAIYYSTRPREWEWIAQRTPQKAGFNPIRGIVLGIDRNGKSLVPDAEMDKLSGPAREIYGALASSASKTADETGWELNRSLGFISVDEMYDVALVFRNDRASASEIKKRERKAAAAPPKPGNRIFPEGRVGERDAPSAIASVPTNRPGKASNKGGGSTPAGGGNANGASGSEPGSGPAPRLPPQSEPMFSPRPLSASSRVHGTRYVDLFVDERNELVRCIAQKGFSVQVAYSSDGQDVHVRVTLPPRMMELVLQDLTIPVAQGPGFGFAPYSFRHRTDFEGYQNRDDRVRYQMPCPAQRLRAVTQALERRAFPFGFYHEKWFSEDRFYPLADPAKPEEPVCEVRKNGTVGKVIPAEDRDYVSLSDAISIGIVSDVVNLADLKLRTELVSTWAKSPFARQPLHKVREYFGGNIAFYFAWLGFYNVWLVTPSLLGMIVFVHQLAEGKILVATLPFYCLFMGLWSVFFLESWKRREAKLSHEWGLLSFEDTERERIEFRGKRMMHPTIPEHVIMYYPRWKRGLKYALGQPVLTLFLGIVVAFIIGMIEFKAAYQFSCGSITGCESYVASLATAVFVIVMNAIYARVAKGLTDWENHRTDTAYNHHLIAKTFAFQFANAFAALFHLGLWEMDLETLRLQLFMNLFVKQIVLNVQELLVPHIFYRRAKAKELKEAEAARQAGHPLPELSQLEKDLLKPASPSSYDAFSEILLQYGYVSLFVAVLPAAPLAALINNFIEIRVDAYQTCVQNRRSDGTDSRGIGTWLAMLKAVTLLSVVTNTALLVFPGDSLADFASLFHSGLDPEDVSLSAKVWTFVLVEHAVLLLQFAVAAAVPDVPSAVTLEIGHQKMAAAARVERELKADGLTFGDGEESDGDESDLDGDGEDDDAALGIEADDADGEWGM